MKIVKTEQLRKFEPVRIVLDLSTEAELNAFFAISRWDITIPEAAITGVRAKREDVRAMIKRFQSLIDGHWKNNPPRPMPKIEVTFELPFEVDEAARTERIPGLADVLVDKPQSWNVGDTVYLRGFSPKRTILSTNGGKYIIADSQTGDLQWGPGSAKDVTRAVIGPTSMYTYDVQKRHPKIGDTLYNHGDKDAERRIFRQGYGCGVKIANPDGEGHHYISVTTLEGIEKLIDGGIYTYEPKAS